MKPGKRVDIGDHKLHVLLEGQGSPAVIMDSGLRGGCLDWVLVQGEVAKVTKVCTYDRSGYGWSDESSKHRTSKNCVKELHTLVQEMGIYEKYILVGHSFGGLNMQLYAKMFPQEVAGVVLVDSLHEEFFAKMKKKKQQRFREHFEDLVEFAKLTAPIGIPYFLDKHATRVYDKVPHEFRDLAKKRGFKPHAYRTIASEFSKLPKSLHQAQKAGPFPDIPATVLSAGIHQDYPPGFSGPYFRIFWQELQEDLASQFQRAKHFTVANSAHYIHLDQPEVVIKTITDMVEKLRR